MLPRYGKGLSPVRGGATHADVEEERYDHEENEEEDLDSETACYHVLGHVDFGFCFCLDEHSATWFLLLVFEAWGLSDGGGGTSGLHEEGDYISGYEDGG